MDFVDQYLGDSKKIIDQLSRPELQKIIFLIDQTRQKGGRLFFLGVGGSAANASHAVNDFRKICSMEAHTPTDNVAELTARVNDDGWSHTFSDWLAGSRLTGQDLVFVLSVGGGNLEKNISPNIVEALQYAKKKGAKICGIVGRDGGFTAKAADACLLVPGVNEQTVTAHTEAFQSVILHLLVSHPTLQKKSMKWESLRPPP